MTRYRALLTLMFVVPLASCSSSATAQHAPSTSRPSAVAVTRTTATASGTTMHFRMDVVPSVPEKKCNSKQCVLLGTETGTVDGDLRGAFFRGNAAVFSNKGQFVVGATGVFRGTVVGCGSGTLVIVGTELADVHRGTGEWRFADGFGTGDLARVTGHGTGTGTVDKTGYNSQWQGVIDCGK